MCGIVGVLSLNGPADPSVVDRMSCALRHRGPDAHGAHVAGAVGLGFRRLSILDLTPTGDQPMPSEDGCLVIVFNGEIFNYVELRRELHALGHRFKSTGDTEVLLHAYQQWGRDCLPRLNGMWAFLIHDTRAGTIFGARDRFGIKPLYRCRTAGQVLFASEIKAIRASGVYDGGPNWSTISRLLLDGRMDKVECSDATCYSDIEQVPAGSAFELRENGASTQWKYWSLDGLPTAVIPDPPRYFRELLEDAVRLRMRSDVPVGVSLSGGLDSTSIISMMANARAASDGAAPAPGASLQAFSFMSAEFDEEPYIRATIELTKAEHYRVEVDPLRLWENLERFLWFQDEPVHSITGMIGYEVYGLARANGVKVVLCGQGADEVLAGYPSYFADYWRGLVRAGLLRRLWREIGEYGHLHGEGRASLLRRTMRQFCGFQLRRVPTYRAMAEGRRLSSLRANPWFTHDVARAYPDTTSDETESLEASLRASVERTPLPLYLRVEDRNSMAHSVEARLPFLDYRLVSMVFQLGADWKLRGPWTKYLLREAMRGCIPQSVRTRTDKMGFPAPAGRWFRTVLYEPMQDLLASAAARTRGLYNVDTIRRDLRRHREGAFDVSDGLFTIAQMEGWLTLEGQGGERLFAPPGSPHASGVELRAMTG